MAKKLVPKRLSLWDQGDLTRLKTRSGAGAHRDRRRGARRKGALKRALAQEAE
ncbi:hypothetical protein [Thermus hydrothermalis]|uniref:hypothetical protein n=1 Tax=Thermus hydrothermalis TaxID=2908148 RepID=UPI001FAAADD1|nr:hypothetical protein [Thermus hydrothermalis]